MSVIRVLAGISLDSMRTISSRLATQSDIDFCRIVHDGQAVLEAIRTEGPFDVLLLDLILPQIDGFAVLERLGTTPHRPKVILMSPMQREQVIQHALSLGVDYYVLHPCSAAEVANRIRLVCDHETLVVKLARSYNVAALGETAPVPSSVEEAATYLLRQLGIPAHIRGYRYLRDAITMIVERVDLLGAVTKELYPTIATRHCTVGQRVERAMRHAIEIAWTRGNTAMIDRLFGQGYSYRSGKPTNSEFMAMLADQIRMRKAG